MLRIKSQSKYLIRFKLLPQKPFAFRHAGSKFFGIPKNGRRSSVKHLSFVFHSNGKHE